MGKSRTFYFVFANIDEGGGRDGVGGEIVHHVRNADSRGIRVRHVFMQDLERWS